MGEEENDGSGSGGGREAERKRRCGVPETGFKFVAGAVMRPVPVGTEVDREPRLGREWRVVWVSGKSDIGGGGCGLDVAGCSDTDVGTGGLGIGARDTKEMGLDGVGSVVCR